MDFRPKRGNQQQFHRMLRRNIDNFIYFIHTTVFNSKLIMFNWEISSDRYPYNMKLLLTLITRSGKMTMVLPEEGILICDMFWTSDDEY